MLNLTDTTITGGAAKLLGQLRHLRVLVLTNADVDDEAIEVISRLPFLAELHLSGTRITDKGMQHLAVAHNLITLRLNATDTTDRGLAHLSGLAHLRNLDIRGLDVTDNGLAAIAQLPLEGLLVQNTPISTDGLLKMADLSPAERARCMEHVRLLESSKTSGPDSDATRRAAIGALLENVKDMPKLQLNPEQSLGEPLRNRASNR